jgi:toxin HigB-1
MPMPKPSGFLPPARRVDCREILRRAAMRLRQLDAATTIVDLRLPPSNRLEALKGNRAGKHSIRINDRWRVCFRFADGDAFDVEITDYH